MVLACFVLDLCSLSPPLLRDLKQCLLQLANFYAISSPSLSRNRSNCLRDKIGLCYVLKNRMSSSHELKVAYSPRGNFSLRDFHHAVNSLPGDAYAPEIDDSGALRPGDMKLSDILNEKVMYSWGVEDFMRKVIVLSSRLPENIDSAMKSILTDAADKCVSMEFLLFEHSSSHLSDTQENITSFLRSLSDLDNCTFQTYIAETRVFHSLVKQWLQDLQDETEGPLQARFIFKSNLVGSLNQLICSLSISVSPLIDGFNSCETCRCHGIPLDDAVKVKIERHSCPVTGNYLEKDDVIKNSVKVGDKLILFIPRFRSRPKLHLVSSLVEFNVMERTNLKSLSEGVIFGTSYFVVPSICNEIEASSEQKLQSELNCQLFQGICNALHSMDQGLVCSSYCNIETMKETTFCCYYILLPSDNGSMLLRHLAGLEEISSIPDVNQITDSSVSEDIQKSCQACLLKIELRDCNPFLHERGLHQNLYMLVKESLPFGSIQSKPSDTTSELSSNQPDSPERLIQPHSGIDTIIIEDEPPILCPVITEDKTEPSIIDEWEQLIVSEVPKSFSPTCISKPKLVILSPDSNNKQLDIRTSRILERLEAPKQLKTKVTSPVVANSSCSETTIMQTKKPLVPFQSNCPTDLTMSSSQLMKPNFQRLKRKHR